LVLVGYFRIWEFIHHFDFHHHYDMIMIMLELYFVLFCWFQGLILDLVNLLLSENNLDIYNNFFLQNLQMKNLKECL